jgi:sRNA-binding carbon storage regulator CsrA
MSLILTRKLGGAVDFTDTRTGELLGTIRILGIAKNGEVRMGFDCPDYICIERDDIKQRRFEDECRR